MRDISLVKRIEFDFSGNVVKNALTLGDIDNDGHNELIVGNESGDISIFKGHKKVHNINVKSGICCLAVGDSLNKNKNILVTITADGWCYIHSYLENKLQMSGETDDQENGEQVDSTTQSSSAKVTSETSKNNSSNGGTISNKRKEKEHGQIICIHMQRIPANSKSILLGDIDGDGMVEMVLALTDRVVRSYRWIPYYKSANADLNIPFESEKPLGKFVALSKWECANPIGSITLHHYFDGRAALLVAQPHGSFMRIRCHSEDSVFQESLKSSENENSESSLGENISGSVDYPFLGMSWMSNKNISTEILGDLKSVSENYDKASTCSEKSESSKTLKGGPYAVATRNNILLVRDEVVLWINGTHHQNVFALTKLDVTGNGSDDIVVCSEDGQTYILDQESNSVRFHQDEPVQAFASGFYNIKENDQDVTCFVYVTFKNTVIIYYDIPLKKLTCEKFFEPDLSKLSEMFLKDHSPEEAAKIVENLDRKTKREMVEYLLYNVNL